MEQDPFFKKVVTFNFSKKAMQFRVSQDLFSSFDVDIGTRRLLRTLLGLDSGLFGRVLDLGCGYGPIGLTLKKIHPEGSMHLVDRDALAVEYARQNAELNEITGVEIYSSLGYDDVPITNFDLIVSNIPGKAGEPVIASFLQDAHNFLNSQGVVAIVVIDRLEVLVDRILDAPNIDIMLKKAWPGHVVFHYRFTSESEEITVSQRRGLERSVYHRECMTVSLHDLRFEMRTVYNIPEFDTLNYRTELLIKGIQENAQELRVNQALVFNAGQGHIPVAVWKIFQPSSFVLPDRDLLSLRVSKNNLILNGCSDQCITLLHQVDIFTDSPVPFDLIVGVLDRQEGLDMQIWMLRQATEQLAPTGMIFLAGSSTSITRLSKHVSSENLQIADQQKYKGQSLLVLRRK